MSIIGRSMMGVIVSLLPLCAALLVADEQAQFANQPERTKPQRVPVRATPIDPQLETILREWERAASGRRRLDAQFTRFRYDKTFEVEKRGTGSLAVESAGRALYRVAPAKFGPGEVSRKTNRARKSYTLRPDEADRWHWTGTSVIRVDDNARTFEEMVLPRTSDDGSYLPDSPPLPEEAPITNDVVAAREKPGPEPRPSPPPLPTEMPQPAEPVTMREAVDRMIMQVGLCLVLSQIDFSAIGAALAEAISEFPLPRPFLLGMPVHELRHRYRIELMNQNEEEIRLEFVPTHQRDQRRFDKAVLILKTSEYTPVALKLVDATGAESVHVFTDVQITREGGPRGNPSVRLERLERPNLQGYRKIVSP